MKIRVAVVQESPVFFDKMRTLEKIEEIFNKIGAESDLIVFPESFIPGYPRGFDFGSKVGSRTEEGRDNYLDYYKNSIDLKGEEIAMLESLSKKHNSYLVIGVTEKEKTSHSLYCTTLYISPLTGLMGTHRKIKPTASERVIWGEGDGSTMTVCDTRIGMIGGLTCWENYMPLARMAMYGKGVEIYIAPTADSRDSWTTTMQHIALEGRCFVIGCNQYFTKEMMPNQYLKLVDKEPEEMCRGGSIVVSPGGEILAGPCFGESKILELEIDLDDVVKSKLDFDASGHYNRKDIFRFEVKDQPDVISDATD